MRLLAGFGCLALAACSADPARFDRPVSNAMPISNSAARDDRRGEIEILVNSHHRALIADIRAGGGSVLSLAQELAGVPTAARPAQILQLQSNLPLYRASPDALALALTLNAG